MESGQTAEIRLQGSEPLENVPRSVAEQGDTVLSMTPEEPDGPAFAIHRLIIRKV